MCSPTVHFVRNDEHRHPKRLVASPGTASSSRPGSHPTCRNSSPVITTFLERLTTSALLSAGTPPPPPPPSEWGGTKDAPWLYCAGLSRSNDPTFGSIPTMVNTSPYPSANFAVGATPIRSPTRLWLVVKTNGYIFRRFGFAPGC